MRSDSKDYMFNFTLLQFSVVRLVKLVDNCQHFLMLYTYSKGCRERGGLHFKY